MAIGQNCEYNAEQYEMVSGVLCKNCKKNQLATSASAPDRNVL